MAALTNVRDTSELGGKYIALPVKGATTIYPVSYTHLDVYKRQPTWQKEGFEILVKREIINSPDVWKARFNQPIMVGEIRAIIGRM